MGWDAYASTKLREQFKAASIRVISEVGLVDCFLEDGGLDCSCCGRALESICSKSMYDEKGWTKEEVQEINKNAKWPEIMSLPEEDRWAYASAKAFLEVCAETGSSIQFSF